MASTIRIEPLGSFAKWATQVMEPLMYWAAGNKEEAPQQTHRWNNTKLSSEELSALDAALMVRVDGIPSAPPYVPILFHAPRTRWGWKEYIVLEPEGHGCEWHVGWRLDGEWMGNLRGGVSRILLRGPVRLLRGRGDVEFFGVDASTGKQRKLRELGRGQIGKGGPHSRVPLL